MTTTQNPCGTYEKALQAAIRLANNYGGSDPLPLAERFLARAGWLLFGIESISCAGRSMQYLNAGDTYESTVIEENGELSVSSWGDWYEGVEQEHCEEEGVIRCGYCGEFTPVEEEWRDTVCESCNHNVAG